MVTIWWLLCAVTTGADAADLAKYVLTDTGSTGGGNTFPGVSWPFGMVKLGPDLYTGTDSYSGYQPTGNFTGFSMLHESGTGGAPKYGVVSQMPVVGAVTNPLSDAMNDTRAEKDFTEVGYYKATLGSGTVVGLYASRKAGLYRYEFPNTAAAKNVLVDVSHVLSSYRGQGLEQHFVAGNISIVPTKKGNTDLKYIGWGTYDNGWNRAAPWTVYFCGHFNRPFTYKTFLGKDKTTDHLVEFSNKSASYQSDTARLGVLFTFNHTNVVSRVGVSFISTDQACGNVDEEISQESDGWDIRNKTRDEWNINVLGRITTPDTNVTKLTQLYTAMYFMHLLPTRKTGENPGWNSSEPYYDDIFTLWDTHRCTTALFHVLQEEYYAEFIRSLIDTYRHTGWLPDGRSSFSNGAVQGGTNADNVLADAYVKGVAGASPNGGINWEDAYEALLKNANTMPPNNHDPRDPTGSTAEGKGALPDYSQLGYITPRFGRSVSRAVEYSMNDFSLAVVAAGLGKDTFATYFNRSRNWRNHWNTNMTALNFTGFLGPRNTSGFVPQDPLSCGGCYWRDAYYQALPWEYSFNAHHDLRTVAEYMGGPERFVQRLEKTFEPGAYPGNKPFGNTIFNPGNEPSFTTPYLYHYAGRQDLAVRRSRHVAESYYAPKPDGLPGNSDAGAMESWLLWNMIGLYPMTGTPLFLIGSPWFADLTIHLGGSGSAARKLRITSTGGGEDAFYVRGVTLNRAPHNQSWVDWGQVFRSGGTLEFELGPEPLNWTTGDAPPTMGERDPEDARLALRRWVGGQA
ncbi:alpha-1,2-mannosidase family protein, partial [Metarhizium brunneum ARSEF 3297]